MHILLSTDDQLSIQREEAIALFREGKVEESLRLFRAILEHWPLAPTATMYKAAAQELLDWGIAESYVETHWAQIEALMYGGESLLSLPAQRHAVTAFPEQIAQATTRGPQTRPMSPPLADPAGLTRRPTPTRRDQGSWGDFGWAETHEESGHNPPNTLHTPAELQPQTTHTKPWPRELRIGLDLFQQGRRKAARMWARSYFESRPTTAETEAYFQQLPVPLQQALLRQPTPTSQRPLDLGHVHTHDSHAAVQAYETPTTATPQTPELPTPTRRSRVWLALGVTLFLTQTAMLLVLWFQR